MENPEARPVADAPWLFGSQGLLLLAFVTLVAAAASSLEVALLGGSLLVVGLLARLWAAFATRRVVYQRLTVGGDGAGTGTIAYRAFCGETVVLETSLENRKPLPLTWVEAWERLPLALEVVPSGGGHEEPERSVVDPAFAWLCQGAALWPYQRARWRHTLRCTRRGVYVLGDARIRTGDPFSLLERSVGVASARTEVVVYPRVVPLRRLPLPLRFPTLDTTGRRSLVTDPTRTAALRAYQPGDPPRLVHWPTTARRGSLQVRVLEPATSLQVGLVLDVRGFGHEVLGAGDGVGLGSVYGYAARLGRSAGRREGLLELALSALASVALYLHQQGQPVGFVANTDPPTQVRPGASAEHLQGVLEAMARLRSLPSQPLLPWLLAGSLPRGATVVLAISDLAPDLAHTVAALEHAGHTVLTLLVGPGDLPLPAQGIVRLSPDRDLQASLEGAVAPL